MSTISAASRPAQRPVTGPSVPAVSAGSTADVAGGAQCKMGQPGGTFVQAAPPSSASAKADTVLNEAVTIRDRRRKKVKYSDGLPAVEPRLAEEVKAEARQRCYGLAYMLERAYNASRAGDTKKSALFMDTIQGLSPAEAAEFGDPSRSEGGLRLRSALEMGEFATFNDYFTEARAPGLLGGLPQDLKGKEDRVKVLKNLGFIVGFNEQRKSPDWVAYRLDAAEPFKLPRPKRFKVDPRTEAEIRQGDYTNTGFDRGHMAPNEAIAGRYGKTAQDESFLMSNITPQTPELNQQLWAKLDEKISEGYAKDRGRVWVITGPVYDKKIEKIGAGVEVPDAFFKIVIDNRSGEPRALAFIVPQNAKGKDDLGQYLVPVAEIEQRTGLDFFSKLQKEDEQALRSEVQKKLWDTASNHKAL